MHSIASFARRGALSALRVRACSGSAAAAARHILPGRLGNAATSLGTDPRADPGTVQLLGPLGMTEHSPPHPVPVGAPVEAKLEWVAAAEEQYVQVFSLFSSAYPEISGVERSTASVKGVDGNDIELHIHKPEGAKAGAPCVLHLHGGGMAMLSAADSAYMYWRDALASQGLTVVGVEFRNCAGKLGPHPFPAGLNDCSSALQWCRDNKDSLGYSKLVISGESGGGNLSITTAMQAKLQGKLAQVDGIFAMCPYIYGNYNLALPELRSLTENDGYMMGCDMMACLASVYDTRKAVSTDPLAWPFHSTQADLEGLPPTVISVNELDPLRDEGLVFYHKLRAAGVLASSRTVNGTVHAGDMYIFATAPQIANATLRDIAAFAYSL